MSESWEWDETLYAQSAGYYLWGRLTYPRQLAAKIVSGSGWAAIRERWMSVAVRGH